MIAGRILSSKEISDIESQYLALFYDSDEFSNLSDSIGYYGVLFESYLREHMSNEIKRLPDEIQDEQIGKCVKRFRNAMSYAFNKGHQLSFALLLGEHTPERQINSFASPIFSSNYVRTFTNYIIDGELESTLHRDAVDILLRTTRRNFENCHSEIMRMAVTFLKKGVEESLLQIRRDVLNTQFTDTGKSNLLRIPYNNAFRVTPAFKGYFSLESPDFEEWKVCWDDTYGLDEANLSIAKVEVHRLNYEKVQKYIESGARNYRSVNIGLTSKSFDKSKPVYFVNITYLLFNAEKFPRVIERSEYVAIQSAITNTISNILQMDSTNLVVTSE